MIVRVRFFNAKTDELEQIREMDYANDSARRWLANACYWALKNGRVVETIAVEDDVLTEEEARMLADRAQERALKSGEREYTSRLN